MSFRDFLLRKRFATSHLQESKSIVPVVVLALAIGATTIFQVVLGFRAAQQWRKSAGMVVDQRMDEVASLLLISLFRDMRGGFESVAPIQEEQAILSSPQELAEILAGTFARFPYIDCFFLWRGGDSAIVFSRTDRPPVWHKTPTADYSFPVTILQSSTVGFRLATLARDYSARQDQFVFFDTAVEGADYQVIARLFQGRNSAQTPERVSAVLGFAVDLDWVRAKYFSEFTHEMERLLGNQGATALSLSIFDDQGKLIAQTRSEKGDGLSQERKFPLVFFDSSSVSASTLDHVNLRRWTARVSAVDDPLLGIANVGARQTAVFILSAALISIVALVVVVRFLRMNIEVFAMKADFVAMVSHELKTPLASISLVGQAMSRGRFKLEQISDYGMLLSKETSRLTRLVENLLSVSRITESEPIYSMIRVDAFDLISEAILRLQTQIRDKRVTIHCQRGEGLLSVMCDREAMTQVFENVIDNAIKYSEKSTEIEITALCRNDEVCICVKDSGLGIPTKDLPLVFDKFFRGRNAGLNGTGLGLSIARKVVQDHGGRISIASVLGQGTVVSLILPGTEG